MKPTICAGFFVLAAVAGAHRLDEYLQLTALSIGKSSVGARMMLTPGVAVAKRVVALIDTDGDGILSEKERRSYAARVLGDVSLSVDGVALKPRVVAFHFSSVDSMRRGEGEIEVDLAAPAPGGAGGHRLRFENRHQRPIATYLVECLAPDDPNLRVTGQTRSREQERYEVRYAHA